jgi:uncharacterized membrane protein YfcA
MTYLIAFGIGTVAGICSGLFGIGGGIVIVPLLVYGMGFSQSAATGTSLISLLMPVGLLGAYEYYSAGKIDGDNIRFGLTIALGIFLATYVGAKIGVGLPEVLLRRLFSVFLVAIAAKLWF